ncbi:MAG: hypothetical protein BWY15_01936 [Firmicutes bacterium ADurb.Bin193]|nr:MAG: hypothetical protein BWY15_01936 [Firmicutes bacterium ADurb.Bin193]
MYKTKNIERWLGYEFEPVENRCGKDFSAFARSFKAELMAQIAGIGCELIICGKGYFFIYGFIRNKETGGFMFFDTGDVRYDRQWYRNMLVREARSENDFTGGMNQRTSLEEFGNAVKRILYSGRRSEFAA